MYDENGEWHCKRFEDCFVCPYGDCIQGTKSHIAGIDSRSDRHISNPSISKKLRYKRLKAQGICPNCLGKAVGGRVYCPQCRAKDREYRKKRRSV